MITLLILLSAFATFTYSQDCNVRSFPSGTVCVCNATYCDTVPDLDVSLGNYQIYSTSQTKTGFNSKIGSFVTNVTAEINTITVNQSVKYQTIIGFGGAFTDAAGINIASLPKAAQQKLLESYFSDTGIGYTVCRVPIGGTDFSPRAYSYDDVPHDIFLLAFKLQPEDINYKIPFIQQAQKLTGNKLKLFATAWTAPPWMKTNNNWAGEGFLQFRYYQLWANYIVKFLDEYQKNNISYWGLTTQNEPSDGFLPADIQDINSMGWTPGMLNVWIGNYLGPTIRNSTHKDLKIILHDDQRLSLPLLEALLTNPLTMSYADGVGVHWYFDTLVLPEILSTIRSPYKDDFFILGTEACNSGYPSVDLGSWSRGASYVTDIFEDLQYGFAGWVDWNMALDVAGGPNYLNGSVDSPVIVNATSQEFYKQPMFYTLGHFSKFLTPGSVRIEATVSAAVSNSDVQALAFLRPDNLTAVVIFNNGNLTITIQVEDSTNQFAEVDIEAFSINTLLYK